MSNDKKEKKSSGYISAKESRRISKENIRITREYEKKRTRKNVPESEYLTTMRDPANVVEFDNLHTYFFTDIGTVKAVDGVSFDVPIGKTVGIVGESGCGKSVTSMSLMQLVQRPTGQTVAGEMRLNLGDKAYDVAQMPIEAMQKIRGNVVSMIFQEPMTSLNPVFRIGFQLDEVISLHNPKMSREAVKQRSIEAIKMVGIADAEGVYNRYPHELSGGMRQRIVIAMALVCNPRLIIADEPTTALDVTIQAQILRLMNELQQEKGTSIIFITHDLGVINEMADDVAVMYCGQVVEKASARTIFSDCKMSHPYTEGLMFSIPRIDAIHSKIEPIPGVVPHPLALPKGCKFAPRCKYCTQKCIDNEPQLKDMGNGQLIRCFYPEKEVRRSDAHKEIAVHHES